MKITTNTYLPFYIFTISVIIILVAPFLLQDGMFMDGQQYACVAQNLANGKGRFWLPIVNDYWMRESSPYFLEHPPLFYFLESLSFRVFGNNMYSERLFCLLMVFMNAYVIHLIWIEIHKKNKKQKQLSWLPILLWIIIPICFWSFQNNMIEIVLSLFALLSILYSLKALLKKGKVFIYIGISGIFILAAFLTKGLPGLFSIATIPLFYIVFKSITFKETVIYSLTIISVPLVIYFLITTLSQEANQSMNFYFNERLLNRINTTGTTNVRFSIILDLFSELLLPMFLTITAILYLRKKNIPFNLLKKDKQFSLFFMLLGFCGSLPLIITMVQKNFYFVASLPCFSIALSFIFYKSTNQYITLYFNKPNQTKKIKIISYIIFTMAILTSLLQIGKYSRDEEKIKDIKYLGGYLRNEKIVSVDSEAYLDWSFQFYVYRKYGINLDPKNKHRTYIITKTDTSQQLLKDYTKIDLPLKQFKLYKQK